MPQLNTQHLLPPRRVRRPLFWLASCLLATCASAAGAVAAQQSPSAASHQISGQTTSTLRGTWTKKGYAVAGAWALDTEARTLELSAEFRTRKAPDLKLFLSPRAPEELANHNATTGAVLIAPLRSASGAQTYRLPEGLDLARWRTLVLHCERFSKLWAVAPISSPSNEP